MWNGHWCWLNWLKIVGKSWVKFSFIFSCSNKPSLIVFYIYEIKTSIYISRKSFGGLKHLKYLPQKDNFHILERLHWTIQIRNLWKWRQWMPSCLMNTTLIAPNGQVTYNRQPFVRDWPCQSKHINLIFHIPFSLFYFIIVHPLTHLSATFDISNLLLNFENVLETPLW